MNKYLCTIQTVVVAADLEDALMEFEDWIACGDREPRIELEFNDGLPDELLDEPYEKMTDSEIYGDEEF